jgi:hypothetical protein
MRPTPRDLAELRLKAEAALRAEDWSCVLELAGRLEAEDPAWWPHLWAPAAALATYGSGGDPVPGVPRPDMCLTARKVGDDDQDAWWRYFHASSSTGLLWTDSLVPVFQGEPSTTPLVVRDDAVTHPDLSELETGVVDLGGPGLAFSPVHPFAVGVTVADAELTLGSAFDLELLPAGEHDLAVGTRTPYGELVRHQLRVVRR